MRKAGRITRRTLLASSTLAPLVGMFGAMAARAATALNARTDSVSLQDGEVVPATGGDRDVECTDEWVPMRDGIQLRARVCRPAIERGSVPVLVGHVPGSFENYANEIGIPLAKRGYVAVVVSQRGMFKSEGEFLYNFTIEGREAAIKDCFDIVEWAAKIERSNGTVGTFGNSYAGLMCWLAGMAQPASLKALFTSGQTPDNLAEERGIFGTGYRLNTPGWISTELRARRGEDSMLTDPGNVGVWLDGEQMKYQWRVPLSEIPASYFGPFAEQASRLLTRVEQPYVDMTDFYRRINVPTCQYVGYWDRLCARSSAIVHQQLSARSAGDGVSKHRLVIGPWPHDWDAWGGDHGTVDWGDQAGTNYAAEVARFYDHVFLGRQNEFAEDWAARVFLLNGNRWITFDTWPPQESRIVRLYLSSNGTARANESFGTLSREMPRRASRDHYVYDPTDPPSDLPHSESGLTCVDQTPRYLRDDILVYQTAPLDSDIVVAGLPSAVLFSSVDAPDTDYFVRLTEVSPDRPPINLCDGWIRAKFRNGFDRPELLREGEIVKYEIEMGSIAVLFRAGSRIRLEISSALFPQFDRNHNTGRTFYDDPDLRSARVTVHHSAEHPSCLRLPII